MTKNNHSVSNDNQYLKDRLYHPTIGQHSSDDITIDKWIDDIYLIIGSVIVILFIFYVIVLIIRKCLKTYEKLEQTDHLILSTTAPVVLRRHSSVRNPFAPNRRSSLDIRFQMESRERRQSKLYFISLNIPET